MLLLMLATAQAAQVTEIPPWLRGDIRVGYGFDLYRGSLRETVEGVDEQVARQTAEAHKLNFGATFSVGPMVAVYFDMPTWFVDRVTWTEANKMAYDPNRELGSMAYGSPLGEDVQLSGSGAGGAWLGLQATPFSEALYPRRNNRSTWLIDVGYRTPDKSSFYVVDGDSRGAGPGAQAFRIGSAFSSTVGQTEPYIRARYTAQGRQVVQLTDSAGVVTASEANIRPGNTLDMMAGVEVHTFHNDVTDADFAFDFRLGYGYQSWQEVPSGLNLPSVLGSTEGSLVTADERSWISGGMGLSWQMFQYARIDVGADVAYTMPYRVEHPYPVMTGADNLRVTGGAELTFLVRTPKQAE
jgi:hypothetical protein